MNTDQAGHALSKRSAVKIGIAVLNTCSRLFILSTCVLAVAACSGPKDANKSNFQKAVQAHYDTMPGLCATVPGKEWPVVIKTEPSFSMLGNDNEKADALAQAGLLSARATEAKSSWGGGMEPAVEYTMTEAGKKYLVNNAGGTFAPRTAFCTGKYQVTGIGTFTEPSDVEGMKVSQVHFQYKVQDAADWAKSPAIQAQFKNFADLNQAEMSGKMVLVLTNEGWISEHQLQF